MLVRLGEFNIWFSESEIMLLPNNLEMVYIFYIIHFQ